MKLVLALLLLSTSAFAQLSVIGKWKTIDDNTGKERSVVEIFEKGGQVYGKITKIYREKGEDPDPVCDECEEELFPVHNFFLLRFLLSPDEPEVFIVKRRAAVDPNLCRQKL